MTLENLKKEIIFEKEKSKEQQAKEWATNTKSGRDAIKFILDCAIKGFNKCCLDINYESMYHLIVLGYSVQYNEQWPNPCQVSGWAE